MSVIVQKLNALSSSSVSDATHPSYYDLKEPGRLAIFFVQEPLMPTKTTFIPSLYLNRIRHVHKIVYFQAFG